MHRVLVTAVGGNIGQGVIKALRAGGLDYAIVGVDMEPRSAGFSFVDRAFVTPRAGEAALTPTLVDIIRIERIEAVFVCSPAELDFFCGARRAIEDAGARLLLNPDAVVRVGQDKLETARFLAAAGFPCPETVAASDARAVDALIDRWGFPVIAKPRTGWTSQDVFRLESRSAVAAAAALVPDLIVQRHLPADEGEYTAGVVGSAVNRSFASIVLRRDLAQGTTYRTELCETPAVARRIVQTAQSLGVEGPCNFQFRLVEGEPVVFEINPRFSGTSGIRFLYGFNDPEMAFEQACLGRPVAQPALEPGVVLRYWNEIHLRGARFSTVTPASRGRAAGAPLPVDHKPVAS